ncbi:MAG: polysaccharide deacetylase family protein [Bacteroidales bacterium]
MLIARIPRFLSRTFRSLTWEIPVAGKRVFLTFDDGPTPEVTTWVLKELDRFHAKATFFCLGNNVEKHPEIYRAILSKGHAVGNHSHSHLKGFRFSVNRYTEDVEMAALKIHSDLFRPPYGRILPRQVKRLNGKFRIIMWTVLSVDYNRKVSGEQVVKNVVDNVRPGSIIVFHDSVKASKNLYYALPKVLAHLEKEGYEMRTIE